jgi:aminopeptidase N
VPGRWFSGFCLGLLLGGTPLRVEVARAAQFSFATTPGKLPKTVVPSRYVLHLQPDLTHFTTVGSVDIDIRVLEPVEEIILNALDLEITQARLQAERGAQTKLEPRPEPDRQRVALKTPGTLAPGKYRLALSFSGRIGEQAQGLFYVKYSTPAGSKVMLATQMEPADARRMFPCWDEPVFRARFDLTTVVPANCQAVSNMPIERESPPEHGLKEVRFRPAPPMPSYLVFLAAGEFEELRDQAEGVELRVLTTQGKKQQGRYALEAAKELLAYYNRYFGIKYPLPKLDQIAIPGGFDGAMENWGAITYDEGALLYDPGASSAQTKREVFVTVAHEMAHQWFGDLVTMAWWNDLWLNEGFASWMEIKATDHFNPAWQMWLSAAADKSSVMSGDARRSTHSIQQRVDNESEANAAFDNITYQKGAALLRMLECYLGPEKFRQGVHRYLSDHRGSNATTADLWSALELVSGKTIGAIAAGWTEQPGLPLVKVKTQYSKGRQIVWLAQERFAVDYPGAQPLLWKIPVALLQPDRDVPPLAAALDALRNLPVPLLQPEGRSGTELCVLLEGKPASAPFGQPDGLIKANAHDTGYYRVWYEPALFDRLRHHIGQFPAADRLNLLDDQWALVEANRATSADFFALVEALEHDPTYALWDKILSTLILIDDLEQGCPDRPAFQQYARSLLQPQFQRLGWSPWSSEPESDALLRSRIIWGLGYFGDTAVIGQARERFRESLKHSGTLGADLRPTVLRLAGRYSDQQTYDELHALARQADGTEERQLCYGAMAEALAPELARQTLALSLSQEGFPQEVAALVVKVANHSGQKELAWDFARQHITPLLARVDPFSRGNYVPSILAAFTDAARAAELEAFVQLNPAHDAQTRAREAAEQIRFKAALKERELPAIATWLAGRKPGVH